MHADRRFFGFDLVQRASSSAENAHGAASAASSQQDEVHSSSEGGSYPFMLCQGEVADDERAKVGPERESEQSVNEDERSAQEPHRAPVSR